MVKRSEPRPIPEDADLEEVTIEIAITDSSSPDEVKAAQELKAILESMSPQEARSRIRKGSQALESLIGYAQLRFLSPRDQCKRLESIFRARGAGAFARAARFVLRSKYQTSGRLSFVFTYVADTLANFGLAAVIERLGSLHRSRCERLERKHLVLRLANRLGVNIDRIRQ